MIDPARRAARSRSFDRVAEQYATARPGYPEAVFQMIAERVPAPARVLEIGPGPGEATLPMARRGYAITAVERGRRMAAVARARLAGYPGVRIVVADFNHWEPPSAAFDLVLAANAFHWADPATRYARVGRALVPGGWLALIWTWNARGRAGRAFWDATDALYRELAPELVTEDRPGRVEQHRRPEIIAAGYEPVERHVWRWRRAFTADEYVALLGTYSDHITLPARRRRTLLAAIHRLIDERFSGTVTREFGTVLYLAHRPLD